MCLSISVRLASSRVCNPAGPRTRNSAIAAAASELSSETALIVSGKFGLLASAELTVKKKRNTNKRKESCLDMPTSDWNQLVRTEGWLRTAGRRNHCPWPMPIAGTLQFQERKGKSKLASP